MTEEKKSDQSLDVVENERYKKMVDEHTVKVPQVGDTVVGTVLSASKAEVRLDIDGVLTGVIRARELYEEADEYANLQPGDQAEATVVEAENENGELELSFRFAGQQKARQDLRDTFRDKKIIRVKIVDANKGGLLAHYRQIFGFLPVSQLAPENYPRINGGDKMKILEKLRSFTGKEFEVKIITYDEKEDKIIFSEKEAWNETQQDIISKYKIGSIVEGKITAVTDFGVFISFGENLEGLIHISELAWQRIDDPADLYKVGETIRAEVINIDGSKIFLSAKKLIADPWANVQERYQAGQKVKGEILKVNPFGLFVKLDEEIHGLAHISQLGLAAGQKIGERFKANDEQEFIIVSIEPKEHRLGLAAAGTAEKIAVAESKPAGDETDNSAAAAKEPAVEPKAKKAAKPKKAKVKEEAEGQAKTAEKKKSPTRKKESPAE